MMGNSRIFAKWTILFFAFAASEVLAGIDSRNIFEVFTKAEQISTDWRDDSYLTYVIVHGDRNGPTKVAFIYYSTYVPIIRRIFSDRKILALSFDIDLVTGKVVDREEYDERPEKPPGPIPHDEKMENPAVFLENLMPVVEVLGDKYPGLIFTVLLDGRRYGPENNLEWYITIDPPKLGKISFFVNVSSLNVSTIQATNELMEKDILSLFEPCGASEKEFSLKCAGKR